MGEDGSEVFALRARWVDDVVGCSTGNAQHSERAPLRLYMHIHRGDAQHSERAPL